MKPTGVRAQTAAVGLLLAGAVSLPSGSSGADSDTGQCVRPSELQRIVFSASKYPNVRRHFRGALRRGWPRRLVVNRRGADDRRGSPAARHPDP